MEIRTSLHRGLLVTGLVFGLGLCWAVPVVASNSPFRFEHAEPLNNLRLTPGARFDVSLARICAPGYSASVRNVPWSEKLSIYREYAITHRSSGEYEIDHLISLELGGSNATANLWPELNDHPRGYLNSKDILENRLHDLVCHRVMSLSVVQHEIATDWVMTYHEVFGSWPAGVSALRSVSGALNGAPTTTSTPTKVSLSNHGARVRIAALLRTVNPGAYETLSAYSSIARDTCVLSVVLPSGATSESGGLGSRQADQAGRITWTWKIGTRTKPGTAEATVRCRAGSVSGTFEVS